MIYFTIGISENAFANTENALSLQLLGGFTPRFPSAGSAPAAPLEAGPKPPLFPYHQLLDPPLNRGQVTSKDKIGSVESGRAD